jgi:hypothetical protein
MCEIGTLVVEKEVVNITEVGGGEGTKRQRKRGHFMGAHLHLTRQCEESSNHLFAFSNPFRGQRRGRDAEEFKARAARHCFREQGLAGARRTEEQNSLGRGAKPLKQLRVQLRHDHSLKEV